MITLLSQVGFVNYGMLQNIISDTLHGLAFLHSHKVDSAGTSLAGLCSYACGSLCPVFAHCACTTLGSCIICYC